MIQQASSILFILLLSIPTFSQHGNISTLTIEEIMKGNDFIGHSPSNIRWSEDGQTIYFDWNPEKELLSSTYKIAINGNTPEKVSSEELMEMPNWGSYNKDYTKKVYSKNGDLFLLNLTTGDKKQITNTLSNENRPKFSKDETEIIYQSGNNLFVWSIATGSLTQITNFKKGSKKNDKKLPENEQWLENDQQTYFEILRERAAKSDLRTERRENLAVKRPLEIYYGSKSVSNLSISPDMNYVTFRLTQRSKSKNTKVPNYVTESGYIKDLWSRSKVGSPQSTYEMGVYDIERDTYYIVDTKQIEGIYDKPDFLKDYHEGEEAYKDKYDKPRDIIFHGPNFSNDGKALIEAKSLDNKDRWLLMLNLKNGELKLLDRQRDEAWVGGPGIYGWNSVGGNKGWINDETFYYQSEATGYSHLYCMNVITNKKKQLTKGKFEIIEANLSKDKKHFYITSNKETPHQHHFYKMEVDGGKMQKITTLDGGHEVTISPDESMLAIRYSFSNKPWELYLMKNEAGVAMKQLTKSTTQAFDNYTWQVPEIVSFEAKDGAKVPARIYRPKEAKEGGKAVVFVHGAGYLQNVHQWWSSYYREYMFHNILTDNGYTVLDIDYRASNGYGRDWRTGIYRFMGGKDLEDQVDGAKFLVDKYNIDPDNIGIYGGSYGGFITLMAMFTKPGTFKSGAALRSVTDWAHYNHGYTSNILNTPVSDSIAYYKSSPIYHAEGLKDNLLILHGMIDTNVQFQDVVRLAQRLIELKKDNWEFAVFPLEGHGFQESSSWNDEYKRIFKLFQDTLSD